MCAHIAQPIPRSPCGSPTSPLRPDRGLKRKAHTRPPARRSACRSPPCHGRADTDTQTNTCTHWHARTQTHRRTPTHGGTHACVSTIAQRAQTHDVASTRSRARAHRFERRTYAGSRAVPPRRKVGDDVVGASVGVAAAHTPSHPLRCRAGACWPQRRGIPSTPTGPCGAPKWILLSTPWHPRVLLGTRRVRRHTLKCQSRADRVQRASRKPLGERPTVPRRVPVEYPESARRKPQE